MMAALLFATLMGWAVGIVNGLMMCLWANKYALERAFDAGYRLRGLKP
jgi:hypothetical protein